MAEFKNHPISFHHQSFLILLEHMVIRDQKFWFKIKLLFCLFYIFRHIFGMMKYHNFTLIRSNVFYFSKWMKKKSSHDAFNLEVFLDFPIGSTSLRKSLDFRLTRSWYEHCSLHSAICITDIYSSAVFTENIPVKTRHQSQSQQLIQTQKKHSLVSCLKRVESDLILVSFVAWTFYT